MSNIDMSLDDIIKSKRSEGRSGGRKPSKKKTGPARSGNQRKNSRRQQPYSKPPRQISSSKVVKISNLGDDVNENDLQEILSEVGEIVRVRVDKYNGQSQGTAKVTFRNSSQARKAISEFDKARVDGRPMYLVLEGGSQQTLRSQSPRSRPSQRSGDRGGRSAGRGRSARGNKGRGRGGRGRGRGGRGGRKEEPPIKLEDLDAEMDAYQNARTANAQEE